MPRSTRPDPELKSYPALTFYYGIGPHILAKLPRPTVRLYVEALPGLIAECQQRALQASVFPWMDKQAAQALWARWASHQEPPEPPDENVPPEGAFTMAHLVAQGGAGGLGVRKSQS